MTMGCMEKEVFSKSLKTQQLSENEQLVSSRKDSLSPAKNLY